MSNEKAHLMSYGNYIVSPRLNFVKPDFSAQKPDIPKIKEQELIDSQTLKFYQTMPLQRTMAVENPIEPLRVYEIKEKPNPLDYANKTQRNIFHKVKNGENTGQKWYDKNLSQRDLLENVGSIRSEVKKIYLNKNSFNYIFPTYVMDFSGIPKEQLKETPSRKSRLPLNVAHMTVSPLSAFKNTIRKNTQYKTSCQKQDFFPDYHPEFIPTGKKYFRQRTKDTEYREAMCIAKQFIKSKK